MSQSPVPKAVVRIELKRADAAELVRADAVLKACEFVSALGANAEAVLRLGTPVRVAAKGTLFVQGKPGHSVFFVLRGNVRLVARNEGSDDVFDVGDAHAGGFVGEAEVLSGGGVRAFSAVADTAVEALELPRVSLTSARGELGAQLKALLEQAQKKRAASLNEMNDFLNRW